jgi:hypothetical protein
MICAFQEGDTQFPCDPGCCLTEDVTAAEAEADTSATEEPAFPIWLIILLIVLGAIAITILAVWAAKKMSQRSSNGL